MRRVIKVVIVILAVAILLPLISIVIIRRINQSAIRITSDPGIQENAYVLIGGIEQYVQIRGEDARNPVILFLHGGPGFPLTYLSSRYQQLLEAKYTFVNWDQRGCGRTYYKNEAQNLSVDLMMSDLHEMVTYLQNRFNCEKVVILGQSWGTVLGSKYAKEHPENVTAYVGIGQVVDFDRGKVFAAETALQMATPDDQKRLRTSIERFKSHRSIAEMDIGNLEELILTSLKYLKSDGEISGLKQIYLGLASPEMNLTDLKWFLNVNDTEKILSLGEPLVNYMYYEFALESLGYTFEVPVGFIQGDRDFITPTSMVKAYYEEFRAPRKEFVLIEDSGHTPFLDHPELYQHALMDLLAKMM